jgi:hypothetical protein
LYPLLPIPRVGDISFGEGGLHAKRAMDEAKKVIKDSIIVTLITFERQHPLLSTLRVETYGGKKNHLK